MNSEIRLEQPRNKLVAIEDQHQGDWEAVHSEQDDALLQYINDPTVTEIFLRTPKWCA